MRLLPLYLCSAIAVAQTEPILVADLLDNGNFADPPPTFSVEGIRPIPWWDTSAGVDQLGPEGLNTGPGQEATQTVALYAPLAADVVLRGRCRGEGRIEITDGEGRTALLDVGGEDFTVFEWSGREMAEQLGSAPVPRLAVKLTSRGGAATWQALECLVPLPAPSAEDLRAEIQGELEWILELWATRGADTVGEKTSFTAHRFDVLTGEPADPLPGMVSVITTVAFDAAQALPAHEGWREGTARLLTDALGRLPHPTTGMPQRWDCKTDVASDDFFAEVAEFLEFLLDVVEHGPEPFNQQARVAAERMIETILREGVAPDGEVLAKFRISDGRPNLGYSWLRRLDVPAQLVRAGRLFDDERLIDVAREAVGQFEYSHRWAGSWSTIDPGFDDEFGHFGERAVTMWESAPEEETFRRLALSGMNYFLPRWKDALRLGGNIAADQVRCWQIAARIAALEPELAPEIAQRVRESVRVHLKGQQYAGGAWGDVTIYQFDPEIDLQVGDTFGPPQNLLYGLAVAHDERLAAHEGGPDLEETRALFTAVMRSTIANYKREHGYLPGRIESAGRNPSVGSMRVAVGLALMLERLR